MSIKIISPKQAQELLTQDNIILIDVREPGEFKSEKIENAVNHPLSKFNVEDIKQLYAQNNQCIIQCLKGARAKSACDKVEADSDGFELLLLEGGIDGWKQEGLPVESGKSNVLPLDRQVQLTIGILLLIATGLGFGINQNFFWVVGFIGLGLSFAGLSGTCMLARLIALMPWNR